MVIVHHLQLPPKVNLFSLVSEFGSLFGKLNFDKMRLFYNRHCVMQCKCNEMYQEFRLQRESIPGGIFWL